jgi:hypothetical protein
MCSASLQHECVNLPHCSTSVCMYLKLTACLCTQGSGWQQWRWRCQHAAAVHAADRDGWHGAGHWGAGAGSHQQVRAGAATVQGRAGQSTQLWRQSMSVCPGLHAWLRFLEQLCLLPSLLPILPVLHQLLPHTVLLLCCCHSHRPAALDSALMRPGRLDVQLYCPPPDQAGRLQVLQVHCRAMPLAPDVDLAEVAAQTEGFSGGRVQWRQHVATLLPTCLPACVCASRAVWLRKRADHAPAARGHHCHCAATADALNI